MSDSMSNVTHVFINVTATNYQDMYLVIVNENRRFALITMVNLIV